MLDSRKHNPNCSFAEELISYLYEEIQSGKKLEFEKHLNNCNGCTNELEAFYSVSGLVKEWHDLEFSKMESPPIEIPYESNLDKLSANSNKNTWLEKLSNAFSSFGMKPVAGFATILVVLGLGWFWLNSGNNSNPVVAKDEVSTKPSNEKDVPNPSNSSVESEVIDEPKKPVNEIASGGTPKKDIKKPQKVVLRKPILKTRAARKKTKRTSVKKSQKPKVVQTQLDSLTEEYAFEDSTENEIRLSDLLDEVGS